MKIIRYITVPQTYRRELKLTEKDLEEINSRIVDLVDTNGVAAEPLTTEQLAAIIGGDMDNVWNLYGDRYIGEFGYLIDGVYDTVYNYLDEMAADYLGTPYGMNVDNEEVEYVVKKN